MPGSSPIDSLIDRHGFLLLDGGLATELQARGYDLDDDLWSAKLLLENPDAIKDVHLSYLFAGANCIITASYQASIPGFVSKGLSIQEAKALMESVVTIADEARNEYLNVLSGDVLLPIIAGSIGPYGAYLADGSEYRGDYGISRRDLLNFHKPRWEILSDSSVDMLACETIPSYEEAGVLLELLNQTPEIYAWVSFSCRDGHHINDGTPISKAASLFNECEQVVAVGVNCTAPRHISSLIEQIRLGAPGKEIIVYPNSGENFDEENHIWVGNAEQLDYGLEAGKWYRQGARLIGGCCRMGPEDIGFMKKGLQDTKINVQTNNDL